MSDEMSNDALETQVGENDEVTCGEPAVEDANTGGGDPYLLYLTAEYHKYRVWTFVLAIVGFSAVLLSVALQQNGIVSLNVYNVMISFANLFIVSMLVIAFTRTRPFGKRIRAYDKNRVSIIDPDAPDGVRIEERALPDLDAFYKILERKVRTELIPETDEYSRLRKIWIAIYVVAAIAAVAAIAMYLVRPEWSLVSTVVLLGAFVLVVLAFYLDRTRMRPLRKQWAREKYGKSEFQVRDDM